MSLAPCTLFGTYLRPLAYACLVSSPCLHSLPLAALAPTLRPLAYVFLIITLPATQHKLHGFFKYTFDSIFFVYKLFVATVFIFVTELFLPLHSEILSLKICCNQLQQWLLDNVIDSEMDEKGKNRKSLS
ncbi:Uncharacterized protein Fot_50619 [Forsythia ovata]|uniref:Uncharacterized protein n=1 Tax=Forsythia ovata TaxID=205694 RepID=A0ABD1PXQ4_9LAMI